MKDITKKVNGNGYVSTIFNQTGDYPKLSKTVKNVIRTVTSCAAVSRGKNTSKNPKVRFGKLLKEAASNMSVEKIDSINEIIEIDKSAGRPLEFAPAVLKYAINKGDNLIRVESLDGKALKHFTFPEFNNLIGEFSYLEDDTIYTNMRAVYNAGMDIEDVIGDYPEYYKHFFIAKVRAPYFVFAQIRTHSKISQIAESARVLTHEDYWLPEDILERIKPILTPDFIEDNKLNCVGCDECKYADIILDATEIKEVVDVFLQLPVYKVVNILKEAKYPKEIYNRWPGFMEYKTWNMAGWLNDPNAWGHLLLEREAYPKLSKSWVQKQTKEVAQGLRDIILSYIKQ